MWNGYEANSYLAMCGIPLPHCRSRWECNHDLRVNTYFESIQVNIGSDMSGAARQSSMEEGGPQIEKAAG